MTPERCYCIVLCAMGTWLLLNRRYKPFGTGLTEWVNYDECPGTRLWLTEAQLQQLGNGCTPYQPGDTRVWLYSDATNPNNSKALDAAYQERIAVLAALMERVA